MDPAAIPAGPELDRLIAEKVMGWKFTLHKDGFEWSYPGTRETYFGNGIPNLQTPHVIRSPVRLCGSDSSEDWTPSTNIAHAWEVVEKMARTDDVHVGKAVQSAGLNDPYYECDVTDGEGKNRARGIAATAPLAICRAALKAIGA